jgi:peptidoglycan/xylan/chitin deacetylase (PgdA/CDA1 family)
MQPQDQGPFPYSAINRRRRWTWPNGAQLALWVLPNLEWFSLKAQIASHPWEKANESKVPGVRQWGQRDYGNRVGVFRMMEVLDKHGIRASATINADVCDYHPEIVEDAVKLGWEFLGHNKTNTTRLNAIEPQGEHELIRYCTRKLTEATGKKPVGWLGSGLAETWNTLDYLVAEGYKYVSDWVNDDQPYKMTVNGKQIVYMPYSYEINDSAQGANRFATGDEFAKMTRDAFDVLYAEGAHSARVMAICLHPFITGQPARSGVFDAALKYICGHDGVWKATGEEILNAYLEVDPGV